MFAHALITSQVPLSPPHLPHACPRRRRVVVLPRRHVLGLITAAAFFSGADAVRAVGPPQKLRRCQRRRRRAVCRVVCVVSCRVVVCGVICMVRRCVWWCGTFPAVSYLLLFKPSQSHTVLLHLMNRAPFTGCPRLRMSGRAVCVAIQILFLHRLGRIVPHFITSTLPQPSFLACLLFEQVEQTVLAPSLLLLVLFPSPPLQILSQSASPHDFPPCLCVSTYYLRSIPACDVFDASPMNVCVPLVVFLRVLCVVKTGQERMGQGGKHPSAPLFLNLSPETNTPNSTQIFNHGTSHVPPP
jgi:hypothetical protein